MQKILFAFTLAISLCNLAYSTQNLADMGGVDCTIAIKKLFDIKHVLKEQYFSDSYLIIFIDWKNSGLDCDKIKEYAEIINPGGSNNLMKFNLLDKNNSVLPTVNGSLESDYIDKNTLGCNDVGRSIPQKIIISTSDFKDALPAAVVFPLENNPPKDDGPKFDPTESDEKKTEQSPIIVPEDSTQEKTALDSLQVIYRDSIVLDILTYKNLSGLFKSDDAKTQLILKEGGFRNKSLKTGFISVYKPVTSNVSFNVLKQMKRTEVKKRCFRKFPGRLLFYLPSLVHFGILQYNASRPEYTLEKGTLWIPLLPLAYAVVEEGYAKLIKKDPEYSFNEFMQPYLFYYSTGLLMGDLVYDNPNKPQIDMFNSIQHPLDPPADLPTE